MNGFWFGVASGFIGATALYVFVPAVYNEVKSVVTAWFQHKAAKKAAPAAPPTVIAPSLWNQPNVVQQYNDLSNAKQVLPVQTLPPVVTP